jgi:hypothetical protein
MDMMTRVVSTNVGLQAFPFSNHPSSMVRGFVTNSKDRLSAIPVSKGTAYDRSQDVSEKEGR